VFVVTLKLVGADAADAMTQDFKRLLAQEKSSIMSRSLELARGLIGRIVTVNIDRPMGSRHPRHGFLYLVNYGYVAGVTAPDGEALDAYLLGVDHPVECADGVVVAVMHRPDDDDDKLVVAAEGVNLDLDDAEIVAAVAFQEQFFASELVRC
jgi:inorganic pyrophosphatase